MIITSGWPPSTKCPKTSFVIKPYEILMLYGGTPWENLSWIRIRLAVLYYYWKPIFKQSMTDLTDHTTLGEITLWFMVPFLLSCSSYIISNSLSITSVLCAFWSSGVGFLFTLQRYRFPPIGGSKLLILLLTGLTWKLRRKDQTWLLTTYQCILLIFITEYIF